MSETMGATRVQTRALGSARPARAARWGGGAAIAAVVAGFVGGQAVALGIVLAGGGLDDASKAVVGLAVAAADLVALAVVVAVARRGADKLAPATLGLRRTRFWPAVGWMFAIYFGVSAVEAIWAVAVGGPSSRGNEPTHPAAGTAVIAILAIAVIAPIVEEIAFRGYLFPALTSWRGPWIGALLTAVLFGAAHFAVYPLRFLPALAVFGFGACLLYWFTGSLLPSIALHALNNGLAIAIAFGWSWQVPLTALGAVAATQLIVAPFARERAPQAQPDPA
jgi:membrane protease YdiL (CAAX protease family)